MKIKKLEPQNVSEKTLAYKEYRKNIKPALKKMIAEHNSPETSTRFIVKTNFEFNDMKGKKMGLIIPGDHTGPWRNMAREEVKADKKNTCFGDCYVKTKADGTYVLILMPEKGAAKKNLMIKQLEKFAVKGTPFSIEVGAGGELEEDNAADAILEDIDLPEDADADSDDDNDEDTAPAAELSQEQLSFKKTMEDRLAKMDEQIAKIKEQLKM